jgi:hypothetical protein
VGPGVGAVELFLPHDAVAGKKDFSCSDSGMTFCDEDCGCDWYFGGLEPELDARFDGVDDELKAGQSVWFNS